MVALGWPALGVPESDGGIGLGFVEVGLLAEELGRATSSGPLPSTGVAPASADTESRLARVIDQAETAMALHMVGTCRRIFELTLDYAKVRVQYDKVIGSFQALKHRFADMYLAVERANAAAYFAAVAIAEDDPRRHEAAHLAKAPAGDCQSLIVRDGLQLHGGIGFTWENDLHFWLKRAKAGEFLCGSSHHHRAELARQLGLLSEVAS